MKQIYDDLWQGSQVHTPGHMITFRTYLLTRENGNIMFYNSWINNDFDKIKELGGIDIQYLSHNHDAHTNLKLIKDEFGSRLAAHPVVTGNLDSSVRIDELLGFKDNTVHSENIMVIPTPGHTNSSLCYYYYSNTGKSYLFVGDLIYFMHGKWNVFVMKSDGGSSTEMKQSLLRLRKLEVDVIVSSVIGNYDIFELGNSEWHTIIDGLIAEL